MHVSLIVNVVYIYMMIMLSLLPNTCYIQLQRLIFGACGQPGYKAGCCSCLAVVKELKK